MHVHRYQASAIRNLEYETEDSEPAHYMYNAGASLLELTYSPIPYSCPCDSCPLRPRQGPVAPPNREQPQLPLAAAGRRRGHRRPGQGGQGHGHAGHLGAAAMHGAGGAIQAATRALAPVHAYGQCSTIAATAQGGTGRLAE